METLTEVLNDLERMIIENKFKDIFQDLIEPELALHYLEFKSGGVWLTALGEFHQNKIDLVMLHTAGKQLIEEMVRARYRKKVERNIFGLPKQISVGDQIKIQRAGEEFCGTVTDCKLGEYGLRIDAVVFGSEYEIGQFIKFFPSEAVERK